MKIVLKYAFFAILFCTASCGNTTTEKHKTVEKASPEVKEATSVLVDNKEKEVVEMTPAAIESTEEVAQPKPIEATKKIVEKEDIKAIKSKSKMEEAVDKKELTVKEETQKSVETVVAEAPQKEEPTAIKKTPEAEVINPEPKKEIKPLVTKFSHDAWNKLLQKHVSNTGKVNYKGFKADKASHDAYLQFLSDNPVSSSASKGEKMAYWINAYNAFTIKLIVNNYPVSSITKLHEGKPWDVKWIKLGDKTYSLNNIENDILRPKYKDARIHFAVNCAAKSCPPILNKAWTAENLNSNLERSAKKFINNAKYNVIGAKEVTISKIFEWYGGDFGDIISYLNKYADTKIDANATVKYQDYNWQLNE